MSHLRKQIRDAVVTALAPLGGVHVSRVHPLAPESLPVFLLYMGSERIESQGFQALYRTLQIVIEVRFDTEPLDDSFDALIVSIEGALNGNLSGLVVTFLPTDIEQPVFSAAGSAPMGTARITYEATYRTGLRAPDTTI